MRKVFTRVICGIIGIVLSAAVASAQLDTLYSGDMNNNGIVNAVDLLYWGQEFGETGPPRVAPSSAYIPNAIGVNNKFGKVYKDDLYPIDIVHADANGDGTIDDLDFEQVFVPNHGLIHGDVHPEGYMNGQPNVDPPLRLVASNTIVEEGDSLTIAIELGDTDFPIDDFYGIAFTMNYETEFTEDSAPFELIENGNGWTNNLGANTRQFINRDESTGKAEYAIVKTDRQGINFIKETVGVFAIGIDDIVVLPTVAPDTTFTISIDSVRLIDAQFRTIAVDVGSADVEITVINTERSSSSECPDTFAPVCANDGNTYFNSCYAEIAGVTAYTSGTCFGDCIDPDLMTTTPCTVADFDQVCGCNGKTYVNECQSEAAGILSYTAGPCNTESDCVDINSVINSGFVKKEITTGEITHNCSPTLVDPVCGCNGVTYQNSCYAEINGLASYTPGSCSDLCIDPSQINPTATCITTYDPVCGCNDVTYNNSCYAEAAGVQSFIPGVCNTGGGGTTTVIDPWCQNATSIFCGDILFNQTNSGENNDFSNYSILPNYTLLAPDKIYTLNKTTTGDLQITLEITTPGLDLDLFLLQGDCNNYQAIAGSWSNNQVTSIETIIVDDAPLGNYYIVVDGQYPASVGDFRLDISCGYLDCSNAVDLECGHPHNYTNAYGEDNVSVYGCDGANAYNNSGPEVVHTVTTTATGQLDITLSNLNANLNMYLLSACDNNACIDNSTNAGTWNEQISAYVPAGTYYIVVDGYNGATSSYNLYVDCAQTCDINVSATATYSSCGQNSGTITVSSTGGTAGYTVDYTGPVSGSLYTYNANCTIADLPPGTYTVSKTDANGCSDYAVVTINDGSNLDFSYWVTDAICGMGGAIEVSMTNGAAPYTVTVTGPKNLQLTAYSNSININDLLAGIYTIQVLDAYGCSSIQEVTIGDSNSGFTYTATPNPANCGQLGSITVNIPAPYNNQNPFNIQLNGPVSGFETTNSSNFNIINLPGGTYNLTVENEYWCQESQVVVIDDNYMTIGTTTSNGICGQDGSITVNISNGTPSYLVEWSGQETGSSWVSNPNYIISNLASGVYTVSVTDDNGCTDYEVVQIDNSNSYLNTAAIGIDGSCGYGSIWVDMLNGNAPYTISWNGPNTGVASTSNDGFDIQNVPVGSYTVVITDANGCMSTEYVTVNGGGSDIAITATGTNGYCGTNGSIWIGISNGEAPYTIVWDGTSSGATSTSSASYDIGNLGSGTYDIVVTDANGCSDSQTITINNSNVYLNIYTNVTNSTCGQDGSIWVSLSGGTPSYILTWDGPTAGTTTTIGDYDIQNLLAGNYTLTATDINGCTTTKVVSVYTEASDLEVTANAINENCGTAGSIWLTITGGQAPYTIDWSGTTNGTGTTSDNNFDIQNLWVGTYAVVVTDANGCTDTIAISISGYQGLVLNATSIDCICGTNGSIWLGIEGGVAPYLVSWQGQGINDSASTNDQNFDIQNLPCGSYDIIVADANGCAKTITSTINEGSSNLDISLWGTDGVCGGYGSIEVSITGGASAYDISWSGASNGTANTSNSLYVISSLPQGSYTVNVTDANGCVSSENITIGQSNNLDISLWGTDGVCGGYGSIEVSITGGVSAYDISWSGASSGTANTSNSSYVISSLPQGSYTVNVTDANGCVSSENITIGQSNNLDISLWGTDGVCGGYGSIEVSMTGGVSAYDISWSGASSGTANTSNSSYVISSLPQGSYTVNVTDANGCVSSENITIGQSNNLDISLWGTDGVCGGYGSIEVSITGGVSAYDISWSGASSGTANTSNSSYVISSLPQGSYTVNVTDANGCVSSENITIGQSNNLDISLWGTDGVCGGYGSIEVSITGGVSAYDISWSGASSGTANTSNSSYVISSLPQGSYTVNVTDANGCVSSENITIGQSNNLDISLWGTDGVCGGYGSIEVSITGGVSAYDISWSGASSGTANTSNSSYVISSLPQGSYTVNVTDANGCVSSENITIGQTNGLNVSLNGIDGLCGSYGSIEVSVSGGNADYIVAWDGASNGTISTSSNPYTITNLGAGNYSVTVTDVNGCSDVQTVSVYDIYNSLSVNATATNGVCGQNGSIWVNLSGGDADYTITWTGAENGTTTTSNSTYDISDLESGTYIISVTDNNGCTITQSVNVSNGNNSLSVSMEVVNGTCGNMGSIWVNFNTGIPEYLVTWTGASNGQATTSANAYAISNLVAGNYNISVSDLNGCTYSETLYVEVSGGNFAITTNAINGVCGSNGSIDISMNGGVPTYNVSWSGPVSGSTSVNGNIHSIPNLPTGSYNVMVVDADGCGQSEAVYIGSENGSLSVSTVSYPAYCNQAGSGSIWLDINGGTAPFNIAWTGLTNGDASTSNDYFEIIDLSAGTYTIVVMDANGCSDTEIVTIDSSGGNVAFTATPNNVYCNTAGSISVNVTSGTPNYTIEWDGTTEGSTFTANSTHEILNVGAGTYTITVTDANGCNTTETIVVSSSVGNLSVNTTATDSYCGVPGSIWVAISGGSAAYDIAWSGAASGSTTITDVGYSIPNLGTGNYVVSVTDANGCSSTSSVTINGTGGTLGATITPSAAYCSLPGSIWIIINNGNPSYTVTWTGPSSGSATTGVTYDIPNLPAGTYTVTIEDANGCSITETVIIENNVSSLAITANPTNAACGVAGSIWLTMSGGAAPYDIEWTGTSTGNATSNSSTYDLNNLSAGTYYITVTDDNDCSVSETVTVESSGNNLSINANPTNSVCGVPGSIWVTIAGGSADYTIEWDGTATATATTNNSAYDISGLSIGDYGITVTDATGCSAVQTVTISGSIALDAVVSPHNGSCSSNDGEINVTVNNGSPNYSVFWTGPVSNSAILTGNSITIDNLPSGDYNVSVEDANGCSYAEMVTINNAGGYPLADFSYSTDVLTMTTTNNSDAGTYSWDFGDGNTSTDTNPIYAFCEEGTYNVCLTVTNSCGTDTHCEMVAVTIPSNVCTLDVGEVNASPGATVYVPVTIENCNLIVSLAGSLDVDDSSVATIVGLSPGAISPQYNTVDQTFNYYDNNGQGITVANGDILFYLVVQVGDGTAGQSTNIQITNSPLMIEVGTIINGNVTTVSNVTLKGNVTIENSAQISGLVHTYWSEGVKDVEVNFIDDTNSTVIEMTDENGEYMHPNVPLNNMYTVQPEKDGNDPNGLSTFALFVGQRFILGMDPIEITSPYQVIAGDANCSGSFTTLDLFLIQQIIIGTNNELNDCPSWVFVKSDADMPIDFNSYNVFPYESSETMMVTEDALVDFVGVKVGDILGHANPHNFGGNTDDRLDTELKLQVDKRAYAAGETVELNFRSPNFENIVSYQMGLHFDNSKLSFVDYEDATNPSLSSTAIGTSNAIKGDLRISWFSTNGSSITVQADEQLFTLRFTANEAIDNIETLFSINSDNILSEAHNGDLEVMDILLEFVEATTTSIEPIEVKGYELAQNTPNPFIDNTVILFELPAAMKAQIVVRNQLGEIVSIIENDFQKGQNTVTLSQKEIGTGVFYYTLKTKEFSATRAMISIE